ncbi:MAG: hypothetical protein ACOXZH_00265 [Bacteroidales bacterium]|nr:hypothetical protein [Bacteroidales bacterium]HQB19289.1 hypothetical protein [Bacteroidales bacterium]
MKFSDATLFNPNLWKITSCPVLINHYLVLTVQYAVSKEHWYCY